MAYVPKIKRWIRFFSNSFREHIKNIKIVGFKKLRLLDNMAIYIENKCLKY